MKVRYVLTVTITPESRNEMIYELGGKYRAYREHFEHDILSSFGGPENMKVRWLLESGRWDAAGPDDAGNAGQK